MYHVMKTIDKPEWLDPETDTRNVIDEFKGLPTGFIRATMQERRVPAINVAMNLTHDFNKSTTIRSGEAFCFQEFVFVNRVNNMEPTNPEGAKRWDKRGSVGMQNYANIRHTVDWAALFAEYREQGYRIFAVDNIPAYNPTIVYDAKLPEKSVFVYGEESLGLSQEVIEACDEMVYIDHTGIPRSLNVASAASICMYEYSRQNRHLYK